MLSRRRTSAFAGMVLAAAVAAGCLAAAPTGLGPVGHGAWRHVLDVASALAGATASAIAANAPLAIDGDLTTAWDSGTVANPTLTLTLVSRGYVTALTTKVAPGAGTYDVLVSDDGGTTWTRAATALTNQ